MSIWMALLCIWPKSNKKEGGKNGSKSRNQWFGRIGRLAFKAIIQRCGNELEVAALNNLTDAKTNAHLFKYDSNYGIYPGKVEAKDNSILVDDREVKVIAERDPAKIPPGEITEWTL